MKKLLFRFVALFLVLVIAGESAGSSVAYVAMNPFIIRITPSEASNHFNRQAVVEPLAWVGVRALEVFRTATTTRRTIGYYWRIVRQPLGMLIVFSALQISSWCCLAFGLPQAAKIFEGLGYVASLATLMDTSSKSTGRRKLHILVVDDDQYDLLARERQLKQLSGEFDFTFEEANGAEEALSKWEEASETHPFDMVLTDCFMKELTGLWLIRNITDRQKGASKRTFVAMISGAADAQIMQYAREYSVDAILDKEELNRKPELLRDLFVQTLARLENEERKASASEIPKTPASAPSRVRPSPASEQTLAGTLVVKERERKLRFLLVDGHADGLELMNNITTQLARRFRAKLDIDMAMDIATAWEQFQRAGHEGQPYDAILIDYDFKAEEGLTFMRRVNPPGGHQTPAYFVTALEKPDVDRLAQDPSVDGAFHKSEDLDRTLPGMIAIRLGLEPRAWPMPEPADIEATKLAFKDWLPTAAGKNKALPLPLWMNADRFRIIALACRSLAMALLLGMDSEDVARWSNFIESEAGVYAVEPELLASVLAECIEFYQHWERHQDISHLKFNGQRFSGPFQLYSIVHLLGELSVPLAARILLNLPGAALGCIIPVLQRQILDVPGGQHYLNVLQEVVTIRNALSSLAQSESGGHLSPESKRVNQPVARVAGVAIGRLVLLSDADIKNTQMLGAIPKNSIIAGSRLTPEMRAAGPFLGLITYEQAGKGKHGKDLPVRWGGAPYALWQGPDSTLQSLAGQEVYLFVSQDGVVLRAPTVADRRHYKAYNKTRPQPWRRVVPSRVTLGEGPLFLPPGDPRLADPAEVGFKVASLVSLSKLPLHSSDSQLRLAFAEGACLPMRTLEHLLKAGDQWDKFTALRAELDRGHNPPDNLAAIQQIIRQLDFLNSPELMAQLGSSPWLLEAIEQGAFVRAATTIDNLPGYPGFGAGVYATHPNVKGFRPFVHALQEIFASLYTMEAYTERHKYKVAEKDVWSAIWVVKSVSGPYSVVIQTADILVARPHLVGIEIAQGFLALVSDDETLGKFPTRYMVDRETTDIRKPRAGTKSFQAILAPQGGLIIVPTDLAHGFNNLPEADNLVRGITEFAAQIQSANNEVPQEVEAQLSKDRKGWVLTLLQTSTLWHEPVKTSPPETKSLPPMVRSREMTEMVEEAIRDFLVKRETARPEEIPALKEALYRRIGEQAPRPQWKYFRPAFRLYRQVIQEALAAGLQIPTVEQDFVDWLRGQLLANEEYRDQLNGIRAAFVDAHDYVLDTEYVAKVLDKEEELNPNKLWRGMHHQFHDHTALEGAFEAIMDGGLKGLLAGLNACGGRLEDFSALLSVFRSIKQKAQQQHSELDADGIRLLGTPPMPGPAPRAIRHLARAA